MCVLHVNLSCSIMLGLIREPKWSHLRDLHKTLRLVKNPFLLGTQKIKNINKFVQVRISLGYVTFIYIHESSN